MAAVNVTVDDFSALVSYARFEDWQTNNATNQIWSDTAYWDGTWHETRTVNATASIQFKGTDVYVYGVRGPRMGSFAFSVDGAVQTISAHAAQDEYRQRIATANNLPYGTHLITLTNLGPLNAGEGTSLLLDYADITVVAGAAGATLTNTTYDDLNPALRYTGDWRNNTNEVFIGGTTTFTNSSATVSLTFNGSALYVIGDRVEDHGPYVVDLDGVKTNLTGRLPTQLGDFKNTLMYLATDLNASEHTVTIENIPSTTEGRPGLASFFDLDAFIVTTPSAYSSTAGGGLSLPGASASASRTSPSSSATSAPRSAASILSLSPLSALFLIFCLSLPLRTLARRH